MTAKKYYYLYLVNFVCTKTDKQPELTYPESPSLLRPHYSQHHPPFPRSSSSFLIYIFTEMFSVNSNSLAITSLVGSCSQPSRTFSTHTNQPPDKKFYPLFLFLDIFRIYYFHSKSFGNFSKNKGCKGKGISLEVIKKLPRILATGRAPHSDFSPLQTKTIEL